MQNEFSHPHPTAPTLYYNVLRRPDRDKWLAAVNSELQSIEQQQVWVPIPKSQIALGTQLLPWNWVFTLKEGTVPKARLVIVGSKDRQSYQPSETYSPVPSPTVIRWFFAMSLKYNLLMQQLDIRMAFLHSNLPYTKYASVPDGLSLDRTRFALLLKKAAYGLAISPLLWYNTLANTIIEYGCVCSFREPCVFYQRRENSLLLIIIYVDDVLIASPTPQITEHCIPYLEKVFTVKRMGYPRHMWGSN